MTNTDPFNLKRYMLAQDLNIGRALEELRAGLKRSHWMWFVFPQMRGLGHSSMALEYGITSLDEAKAYLAHPLLGSRLVTCVEAVLATKHRSLSEIFGSPDDLKFCSSMTLFACADGDANSIFQHALERFCDGIPDGRTLALLIEVR